MRRTLALAGAAILTVGLSGLAGPASADSGIAQVPDIHLAEVAAELDNSSPDHDYDGGFIEIFNNNPSGTTQSLNGWSVEVCNSTSGRVTVVEFGLGDSIAGQGTLLIADRAFVGPGVSPDRHFDPAMELEQSASGAALVNVSSTPVDTVRWGMPGGCTSFVDAGDTPNDDRSLNRQPDDTWLRGIPTPGV